jgi:two-component sensor histidine kinase
VKVRADGVFLGIDTAIPCGLIINELISNSLKYAFPNDRRGTIAISLKDTSAGNHWDFELLVSDDGIGLPDGMDVRKTDSLGLQLVTNLAEHQLQGTVELLRAGGAGFRVYFKEPKYKSR